MTPDAERLDTLTREMQIAVLAPSDQKWPKRPSWLKGAVERELGMPVLDAYINQSGVVVQFPGSLELVQVEVSISA